MPGLLSFQPFRNADHFLRIRIAPTPVQLHRTVAMEIHMDPSQVIFGCAEKPPERRRLGHRAA